MANRGGILTGWLVVSADRVLENSALIWEDGVIVDLVPNDKARGMAGVEDLGSCIVVPGFLNTHCHMYNRICQCRDYHQQSTGLLAMLKEYWWSKIEDRVDHEIVKISTRYSCLDLLKNGVTCVDDILEAPNSAPGCLAIEADILDSAGLRGVLSLESSERLGREKGEVCLKENYRFIQRQRENPNTRVMGMMCTHTTFSCSADFLRLGQRMAKKLGADIQLHCSEGVDESRYCLERFGKLPMEYYEEIGFLDSNVLASQCVIMDPAELSLMERRKVRVSHQPVSNSMSGCGIAPVADLLRRKIPTGIGTDGELNDMLENMRLTAFLQKARLMDAGVVPTRTAFHMATAQGAAALGYPGVGTLEPGMAADYVALDMEHLPNPVNEENIFDQIVYHQTSADIRAVAVAGETLVKNGECLTVDEKQATREMRECTAAYWAELDAEQ